MNSPAKYKLSPSDFKFLWEDCKHCYYQKVVNALTTPSTPFPSIFTKMNSQLQTMALQHNLSDIISELPSGKFDSQEGFLKSKPIPNKLDCYLNGRFDLLTKFDDGTYGVLDLKITDPSAESLAKYDRQLHAYKFAHENPAVGEPKQISRMGLLVIQPQDVRYHKGYAFFRSKPIFREVIADMPAFYGFIDEISEVLGGELPLESSTCGYCIYRAKFKTATLS